MAFPIHHIEEYYSRRQAQSNEEYIEEIKELRQIIWCLIEASGGEIKVPDYLIHLSKGCSVRLETEVDAHNQRTRFRSR